MRGETYELTDLHVALLRHMWVSWCADEFGAPTIDPKRPYGNGDVLLDIEMILRKTRQVCEPTPELCEALHRETEWALAIVLRTGSFEPGTYRTDDYGATWRRV